MLKKTGFRLFASLGRNDGGVKITIRAKVTSMRQILKRVVPIRRRVTIRVKQTH